MTAKEQLVNITLDKEVYCYGAGNYGKTVAYSLIDINVDFKGFIVTNKNNVSNYVMKKKVYSIDEINVSANSVILVCVNSFICGELEKELKERQISNYYIISEQMVAELNDTTDFEADVDNDKKVNVLLYHRVCDIKPDIWNLAVSPVQFELQMKYLKENFSIIRFEDDWSDIKKKSVVITFDDGYVDNYKNALPILEKYEIPATFFISTGNIDSEKEFWWDELSTLLYGNAKLPSQIMYENEMFNLVSHDEKKMFCQKFRSDIMIMDEVGRCNALNWLHTVLEVPYVNEDINREINSRELIELSKSRVITIGAHTQSHGRLAALNSEQQFIEIYESKKKLENITNKEIKYFSYPFGCDGDYDETTVKIVRECGFLKSAAVKGGLYDKIQGEYEIPRNSVPGGSDLKAFKKFIRKIWYEY